MTAAVTRRRTGLKPRLAGVKARRADLRPGLAVVVWAVAAVSLAGFAAAWVLAVRNRDVLDVTSDFGPDRFLIAYAVVGAVLASRRPANPVGWLLLGIGLVVACRGLAGEYALHALAGSSRPALGVWGAWFINWSLSLLFPGGLLTFLLLLFPNGRLLGRWWRAVAWLGAVQSLFFIVMNWLDPSAIVVSGLPSVPNPTGVRGWVNVTRSSLVGDVAWISAWACLILAAVSVFVRYRRSAGEERLQLKWFAYAAVMSLVVLVALIPVAALSDAGQVVYDVAIVVAIGLALPVAIGVAVLKYRLYAIDRIISRSVSYAVVTGLVVGVYLGCVALLTDVLPVRGSVGVAVAVLVAAALFNPLRRRVQAVVNRRFDRARYDAERVVERFSVQLREQVDLDVLGADLLGVVHQVLAPAHLALWLNEEVSDKDQR
jgi:hypothetical protein